MVQTPVWVGRLKKQEAPPVPSGTVGLPGQVIARETRETKKPRRAFACGTMGLLGRFNLPSRADLVYCQLFATDCEMSSRLYLCHCM
jgi:hypothetical protein